MRIAILGTGKVGTALGARLSQAGHEVTFGSRGPGEHPGSVSQAEAVKSAELVITAIPGLAMLPTLEAIGEDAIGDRIILDPSVAMNADRSLAYPNDSVARKVQERFPRARVVKSLNTMNVALMVDPLASVSHATVFISADDGRAKETVVSLLHDLGWADQQILDLGGVATATATEHAAPLFFATFMALQTPVFSIAITR